MSFKLKNSSTSWPYLISEFLVVYITIEASDWPRTFFTPKVFLFSINSLGRVLKLAPSITLEYINVRHFSSKPL